MITTELNTLSDTSKIWIYQSPRTFTDVEMNRITNILNSFMGEWNSHGKDLTGAFEIINNQFILIAVDEKMAGASGCSIDSSVNIIKAIGNEFNLDLLNKSNVAYSNDSEINISSFRDIKPLVENGKINASTLIFDLSVTSISDIRNGWPKQASQTWVSRFL